MSKYAKLIQTTWQQYFVYRVNFLAWRVRNIVYLLSFYFLWMAAFQNKTELFGYNLPKILGYIFAAQILRSIVLGSRTADLAGEINSGRLSICLVRPISVLKYWFSQDIADKILNLLCLIIELSLVFFLLKPPFFFQTNLPILILFCLSVFLGIILYFYIDFLLGLIGFWSPETWAPRFLFIWIIQLISGSIFPLDILPKKILSLTNLSPFTYLIFFPIKVYLGEISNLKILSGILICSFWIIFFYVFLKFVWQKGLKNYSSEGI